MRRRRLAVAAGVFAIVTGVVIWVGTHRPEPPASVWGAPPPLPVDENCMILFHVFRDGPNTATHSDLLARSGEDQDRYARVRVMQAPSEFRYRLHKFWNSYAADDEDLGTYSATGETRDIDGKTWRKFVLAPK